MSGWRALVGGALGGYICWFVSFPFDVIKTKIQCRNHGYYKTLWKDGGMIHVAKKIYRAQVILFIILGSAWVLEWVLRYIW